MSVDGKVRIVTGAGSGLGEAGAKRLAHEGARLIVADRDQESADRVAGEIRAAGGGAAALGVDVSVFEDTQKLVDVAVASYGYLDFAFNNAGITPALIDVHEIDPAEWLAVISINLTGIFYSVKAELSYFVEHGGGTILNMASTAGVMAHPGRAAYSASKHGIVEVDPQRRSRVREEEHPDQRCRAGTDTRSTGDRPNCEAGEVAGDLVCTDSGFSRQIGCSGGRG
jgi:NAD(P)-dependent dehydrogenase (short-subunit alcohol dehydrogenase family)